MGKRKRAVGRSRQPKRAGDSTKSGEKLFHPLCGYMKGLVRVMPGTDLTRPADPEWADRLDAKYGKERRDK